MANHAPILKSTIDPNYLAQCITEAYGWQSVRCQLIKATMRDMYDIQTEGQRYVAGLYRWQPERERSIHAELEVIAHAHDAGIATARPLPTQTGERLLPLQLAEGVRFLVLFEWVDGTNFPRTPQPEQIMAYGAAIGQLHTALNQLTAPLARPIWTETSLLDEPLAQLRQTLHFPTALLDELDASATLLRHKLAALPKSSPSFGLIHGDVIPSNALYTSQERLYLIDFDLCGYGWRMLDVATFLNEVAFWGMGDTGTSTFLAGYETQRPLPNDEKATLPLFGALRNIWTLGNAAAHINLWGRHLYFSERLIAAEMQRLRQYLRDLA